MKEIIDRDLDYCEPQTWHPRDFIDKVDDVVNGFLNKKDRYDITDKKTRRFKYEEICRESIDDEDWEDLCRFILYDDIHGSSARRTLGDVLGDYYEDYLNPFAFKKTDELWNEIYKHYQVSIESEILEALNRCLQDAIDSDIYYAMGGE